MTEFLANVQLIIAVPLLVVGVVKGLSAWFRYRKGRAIK